MKKLKYYILTIVLLSGMSATAQNQINISQYMLYQSFVNPSAIGTYDDLNIGLLFRNQWVGFDGAPQNNMLHVSGALGKSNMRLGLGFNQDEIGIVKRNNIYADVAYRINVGKNSFFVPALSLGINMLDVSYNELINSENDPLLSFGNNSGAQIAPLARFGLYYFNQNFYVTAFIPSLTSNSVNFENNKTTVESEFDVEDLHYYLQGGYQIKLNKKLHYNISSLIKSTKSGLQYDVNMMFTYNDIVGLGASYRSSSEMATLINFKLFKQLRIGYAYDYALGDLQDVSSGSHEVFTIFELNSLVKEAKVSVPRF